MKAAAPATVDPITSRDNRWLKRFRAALHGGEMDGDTIGIEGPHLIAEAIQAGLAVEALLTCPGGERHAAALVQRLPADARRLHTTDKLFANVAGTRTPQGVAALVEIRRATLDDILAAGATPLVAVLAGVQDPGNVGAVVRAAEAFGASGVIATAGTANPWGQKPLRASAGSALRLPILAGMGAAVLLAQLRVAGLRLVAAVAQGGESPAQVNWRIPIALLIGNEGAGLPPEVLRSVDQRVSIPLTEPVDSLNAGAAAAVLLYEAARQRSAR
jgi:TrmH family RNA methyltransferase